jgi:hypothetical protein
MRWHARGFAVGAVLALSIWALGTGPAIKADEDDDKAIKESQKDVVALAGDIQAKKDGKVIAKKVAAIRKKYDDLNHIMQIYKPRGRKGLGIGPKGKSDGIEFKIGYLAKGKTDGKTRLTAQNLKAQEKDLLLKVGYINLAMVEVTRKYLPTKPKEGKGKKEWAEHSTEMEKATNALIKAIRANNINGVKAAAKRLDDACTSCHTDFRDKNG